MDINLRFVLSWDPIQWAEIKQHLHEGPSSQQYGEILQQLRSLNIKVEEIKHMDQETQNVLNKIDTSTTKIGANVGIIATNTQTIANTDQVISDELDALIVKLTALGNTPPDVLQALQKQADNLQKNSDASDAAVVALQAQIPVLEAIAAKGQPTVPDAPPAPEPTTV